MADSTLILSDFVNHSSKANVEIQVIVFDVLSDDDKKYIKDNLVKIAKGNNSTYPLKIIAKKLNTMLDKQTTDNKHGLTAEFFQAIILKKLGFKQEYAYSNLEENSAKKGFDGLFTDSNHIIWLLESKSSYTESSHHRKHKVTIDRAYNGLTNMLSGNTSNDPWENAVSHAKTVDSNKSLIQQLVDISVDYTNDKFIKMEDSNIILGSAIIHENVNEIKNDSVCMEQYANNHTAKNEKVSAITFSKPELLLDFLEELANE